MQINRRGLSLR